MHNFVKRYNASKLDSINDVVVGGSYKILHKKEHHFVVLVLELTSDAVHGVLLTDQNNSMAYNDDGRFIETPLTKGSEITFDKEYVVSVHKW